MAERKDGEGKDYYLSLLSSCGDFTILNHDNNFDILVPTSLYSFRVIASYSPTEEQVVVGAVGWGGVGCGVVCGVVWCGPTVSRIPFDFRSFSLPRLSSSFRSSQS